MKSIKFTNNSNIRLYIKDAVLAKNSLIDLDKNQSNYLHNVMRKVAGDHILIFNEKSGEWLAKIDHISKKNCTVSILEITREPSKEISLELCFAPVKKNATFNIIQKSTELGISTIQPIITQNTNTTRINAEKFLANAIESAEQCERLSVPKINKSIKFEDLELFKDNLKNKHYIFCDESGAGEPILKSLSKLDSNNDNYSIIIGPEGGFSKKELEKLHNNPHVTPVTMGPRILRADTAVISAISCYMSILGDWDEKPAFKTK